MHVVDVPLHAPLHPLKLPPDPAVAVRVTLVLTAYTSEQSDPQLMPVGLLVTVPLADPVTVVSSVNVSLLRLKAAVTVVSALMVTVQFPVPLQPPPLQPEKTEPPPALAVKVTELPLL
jgi:hypothetical protein